MADIHPPFCSIPGVKAGKDKKFLQERNSLTGIRGMTGSESKDWFEMLEGQGWAGNVGLKCSKGWFGKEGLVWAGRAGFKCWKGWFEMLERLVRFRIFNQNK